MCTYIIFYLAASPITIHANELTVKNEKEDIEVPAFPVSNTKPPSTTAIHIIEYFILNICIPT